MACNNKTQYGTTFTKKFFFHDFLRLVYNFPSTYVEIGLGIGTFEHFVPVARGSQSLISPLFFINQTPFGKDV
jgi:hypothetical protein